MIATRIAASLIATLATLAAPGAHAQLTEAEKRLLRDAGVSVQAAREYGKAGDAAALERIVRLGDPQLVRNFAGGLQMARMAELTRELEALVIAHFDDPRVGAAIRDFEPRYRSRRLFDLYLARIRATIRSDEPAFRQILRTAQPGIDDDLLAVAAKFPPTGETNDAVLFLARRKHPGAVPLLIGSLEQAYRAPEAARYQNRVTSELLAYPSVDVWRRASDEIDRLHREGRMSATAHASARKHLDTALANPQGTLDRMRRAQAREAFGQRRGEFQPGPEAIGAWRESDPRRYAKAQAEYLARSDALVAESGEETLAYDVGHEHFLLGMYLRFRLGDALAALPHFERAAAAHHALGQVALADTYQLELRDRSAALAAYETALEEASRETEGRGFSPYARKGTAMNQFWREWLAAEVAFVRSGRPFRGRISERAIGGFFEVAIVHTTMMREYFRDAAAPASRFALLANFPAVSALPKDQVLREMERHDPGGFWTTCVMGAVLYFDGSGDAGRELAERTGVAWLLPGIAAPGRPTALNAAALQYLQTRRLRVKAEKP